MKKNELTLILIVSLIAFSSCNTISNDVTGDGVDKITIYGNVIDRSTGEALYNVLIQEKNKVGGSTVTGNDGNYEFTLPLDGKSHGVFTLVASKSLYSDAEYELSLDNVDKGRKIRVDFQLETGVYHVEGTVTDINGKPLSNVLIKETYNNTGTSVYSDKSGYYKLDLLPYSETSNKYVLTASVKDYYSDEYTLNFTEKDYGRISTINFQLETSVKQYKYCYIEGYVKAFPGSKVSPYEPIANVLISVYKHKEKSNIDYSNLVTSALTNEKGRCHIDLPIDDEYPYYTITADKSNWYFMEHESGNTWYDYKTLQLNSNMEGQTFQISWQGYHP